MPISRQTLSETLSDDLASLHKARAALSNAWALRMSASQKAHFVAEPGRNQEESGEKLPATLSHRLPTALSHSGMKQGGDAPIYLSRCGGIAHG